MSENKHYDVVVVGAGIAGLSIAEMLQRSGRKVMLVEKNDKICFMSSADMAGWFHTGALYAPLPDPSFYKIMAGNVDDLLTYYEDFPSMNLRRAGSSLVSSRPEGWFTNSLNQYAYAHWRSSEVPLHMKAPWYFATRLAKARIEGFEHADQTTSLSSQVSWLLRSSKCSEGRDLPFNLGSVSRPLVTKDRTMRPQLIISDLLGSFLHNGGDLKVGYEFGLTPAPFTYDKVIKTMGRESRLARAKVISPLVVVYPAISKLNFIKMTPDLKQTLNHMYHEVDGVGYSLIGSGEYLSVTSTDADKAAMSRSVQLKILEVFPGSADCITETYWGYKTEVLKSGQLRNYQYHILETEHQNVIEVLPGKFSLAFSLAVNVCKYLGIAPVTKVRSGSSRLPFQDVSQFVAPSRHASIAKKLASRFSPASPCFVSASFGGNYQ